MTNTAKGKLTLGPLLFHWAPETRRDFYARIADEAEVDCVYFGEVVCSKREPFFEKDDEAIVSRLEAGGKQVVRSTLALMTLDREVAAEPGDLESAPEVHRVRDRLIEAFAEDGIIVPPSAALLWTGSEADRLAHCATPADEWVLGLGVFTNPWDYPPMDASFRKSASFHSWVWLE